MIRIVVTGSRGFIGAEIVSKLQQQKDYEVISVSRSASEEFFKVKNYSDSPGGDVLLHLGENSNQSSVTNGGIDYKDSALQILGSLLDKKYQKVIYASSAILYGDKSNHKHSTGDELVISNLYGELKKESEDLVLGTNGGIVVRLSNVYGPRMSKMTIISQILSQLNAGDDIVVDDSRVVRDFLWIEDAARGFSELISSTLRNDSGVRVYNLGTGVGTSIETLTLKILEIAGLSNRHVKSRHKTENFSKLIVDYSLMQLSCGWEPEINLVDGLTKLLQQSNSIGS